jgi:hypothetical protein
MLAACCCRLENNKIINFTTWCDAYYAFHFKWGIQNFRLKSSDDRLTCSIHYSTLVLFKIHNPRANISHKENTDNLTALTHESYAELLDTVKLR